MEAYLQTFLKQFQHLKIQLEEIKSATDDFNDDNCIGVGGFGKVYKGQVSHSKGRNTVAIKRLGSSGGQRTPEFLKETTTLSRYGHENLISLLGFCYEQEEMILVYEHASRGSLDRYLNFPHLTWSQRIRICLDAAKGLSYLHDPRETHQRLIHCDIKSSNILLDDQSNAKISDLGLSIMGSANEQQSLIVTSAAGTPGYYDPMYAMTHTLTKESGVYSLGVVLFEVLCGTLCSTYINGRIKQILVPRWIESYKQKKLNDIIFKSPTIQPLDLGSLKIFSDIAYRCLNVSREDRPMMTEVITELETALESEEISERMQLFDYEEMTMSAEPPLDYSCKSELWKLLRKGVLLNNGKLWFALNKKGEHCEMISFAECLVSGSGEFKGADNSRFAVSPYRLHPGGKCKVRVKTQFLSPGITYMLNLVLRKMWSKHLQWVSIRHLQWVSVQYKLVGETETSNSYIAYESDGGYWWMCELYQFTSDQSDHEIMLEFEVGTGVEVEGIDFRPVEEVEHTNEKQSLSDSGANWEEKLPTDYKVLMERSKDRLHWTTKKEAYSIMCKGFLFYDGQVLFSLDNDGSQCFLQAARAILKEESLDGELGMFQSSPGLRFGEVFKCFSRIPVIKIRRNSYGVAGRGPSDATTYFMYLVYKLPKDFEINRPVLMVDGQDNHWYIYLASPKTPVIRPKADQNTHVPVSRPKIKGLPQRRDDGWMEVQIWEMRGGQYVYLKFPEAITFTGLIIEGVEFRCK